jgi:dihydroorotase
VSDHRPQDEDKKKCEFELASYGAIGLQTVFSQMIEIYGIDKTDKIVEILSIRPARTLKLANATIKEGAKASLTIFDPSRKWILNNSTNKSKSENSPLWNKELTGKAIAIVNKGKLKKLN